MRLRPLFEVRAHAAFVLVLHSYVMYDMVSVLFE
jgi:hypothetical protein